MAASDIEIMQTLRTDSKRGFGMLMERYEQPLYSHIRRLVVDYDDAKDAAQETFIRIFRSFPNFSGGSFSAWLYRIATNEALRIIEHRREEVLPLDKACEVSSDDYFDYSDAEAVLLQKAIHTLPPKQQAVFNMRYYDEMDYEAISEVIGSSTASAKMNYHLAKDKIVKYMIQNEQAI